MEILLGCGSNHVKKLWVEDNFEWNNLITLDINASHNPSIVFDITNPLPFDDDSASEIHAYEVLEHCGRQGDYEFFFNQFSDFWRVLKNGGYLLGTVPSINSPWAWGDPSHTRVIPKESFVFLTQSNYSQVGITPMSDFRSIYKADFELIHLYDNDSILEFVLRAVK